MTEVEISSGRFTDLALVLKVLLQVLTLELWRRVKRMWWSPKNWPGQVLGLNKGKSWFCLESITEGPRGSQCVLTVKAQLHQPFRVQIYEPLNV